MFRKIIGLHWLRRLFCAVVFFGCAGILPLIAAPDPDIFDGRWQKASQVAGGGQATAENTADSGSSGGLPERDFNEVGGVEQGGATGDAEHASAPGSVGSVSDEAPQPSRGESVAAAGASEAEATGTKAEAGGGSGGGTKAEAGGGSGGGGTRDFDAIGTIGSGGAIEAVEVNSSKASGSPAGAASGAENSNHSPSGPAQPAEPHQQQDVGRGSESSQPREGRGSGDLGDTLPSGL
jgi:hypothetical protein